ncbi:hypothetical protein [Lentzea albida]|uniref:Uncharacterized protein n=1 Tax=Lentzea albida TaxID=65499 RepID=A0A1H9J0S3_9PSEU|nr:hypothetical protein [Lentzea albida]SEQ80337.1 hypothetical protein SAMN04488000_104408 [Lentzea albida]
MIITASDLDARLALSGPPAAQTPPHPFEAECSRVLHGQAPLRQLVLQVLTNSFITAAPGESNELRITRDDNGDRVLDLYSRLTQSPFFANPAENPRLDIRGRDVVEFVCADPSLDIRINQGTEFEVRIAATLLRDLALALQRERTPNPKQQTITVGTVRAAAGPTENFEAAQ